MPYAASSGENSVRENTYGKQDYAEGRQVDFIQTRALASLLSYLSYHVPVRDLPGTMKPGYKGRILLALQAAMTLICAGEYSV